jgi:hypothetical protein
LLLHRSLSILKQGFQSGIGIAEICERGTIANERSAHLINRRCLLTEKTGSGLLAMCFSFRDWTLVAVPQREQQRRTNQIAVESLHELVAWRDVNVWILASGFQLKSALGGSVFR